MLLVDTFDSVLKLAVRWRQARRNLIRRLCGRIDQAAFRMKKHHLTDFKLVLGHVPQSCDWFADWELTATRDAVQDGKLTPTWVVPIAFNGQSAQRDNVARSGSDDDSIAI